jgi:serine protease AprX
MSARRSACLAIVAALAGSLALSGNAAAAAVRVPASGNVAASGVSVPAGGGLAPVIGDVSGGRLVIRVGLGADPFAVARGIEAAGARVLGVQAAIGTVVAEVPAAGLDTVRRVPGVGSITADYALKAQSLGFDPATQPGAMTSVTTVTGATGLWQKGWTGSGVDVALIDTGVAPVPGLKDAAKVVVGPDLSFESQDADLRYLDTFGHGTHLAGIIAGREVAKAAGSTYAADTTDFAGMAPDARLVSLKLADHNGVVDVSQIIAAVDWVVQNRQANGLNIRVLNFSYGTHSPQSPRADPLAWAADTHGTVSMSDDTIPSFSARQGGNFATRGIDVVAPGVGIVSLGVPGSYVYETYPSARVGNGFLRGSGTSQAAAVVSGAAALLLSQRSTLAPNEVKALLINGATKLTGQAVAAQGNGEINLTASSALAVPLVTQSPLVGNGAGGLESARGGVHVTMSGNTLADERDIMGNSFVSPVLSSRAGSMAAWGSDGSFNGAAWIGTGFGADTTSWAGKTWAGKTWGGKTWGGKTWSGKTWSGETWSGKTWAGAVWTGSGWSSISWTAPVGTDSWAGAVWTTKTWN